MEIAHGLLRTFFALVFLLGAIVPSVVAIAAPQAATEAFLKECHLQKAHALQAVAAGLQGSQASGPESHSDHDFFGACVCVLCLTPAPPNAFGDAAPIIILPAREAVRLSFATGVSATFGPHKTTNFATGPPRAAS